MVVMRKVRWWERPPNITTSDTPSWMNKRTYNLPVLRTERKKMRTRQHLARSHARAQSVVYWSQCSEANTHCSSIQFTFFNVYLINVCCWWWSHSYILNFENGFSLSLIQQQNFPRVYSFIFSHSNLNDNLIL